jgi:hypothetical protein
LKDTLKSSRVLVELDLALTKRILSDVALIELHESPEGPAIVWPLRSERVYVGPTLTLNILMSVVLEGKKKEN